MKKKNKITKAAAKPQDKQLAQEEELDDVELLLAQIVQVPQNLTPIILALAICYHTRLGTTELRSKYRCILPLPRDLLQIWFDHEK